MRQSGDLEKGETLTEDRFHKLVDKAIAGLDVAQARREVEPFVKNVESLSVWSREFFRDTVKRIELV